jgi:DNA-binding transcriptional regulator YhcF (GntR family)
MLSGFVRDLRNKRARRIGKIATGFIEVNQQKELYIKMSIEISQEFKSLIPPLSAEEYAQLEKNIIDDGCREPLVVWGNILIDGHNRYAICTKHDLPFSILEKHFNSESDVKLWMITNQFGRRNLNNFVRSELALKMKPLLSEKAKENQIRKPLDSVCQKSDKQNFIDTKKELAKQAQVSHDTIAKTEKILTAAAPEIIEQVRAGDMSINQAYKEVTAADKSQKLEAKKAEIIKAMANDVKDNRPIIRESHYSDLFQELDDKSVDLLITDPPYSTDIADINGFVDDWLFDALSKINDTGRAYICIGAYPVELSAYINKLQQQNRFILDNPLVWTYKKP